MASRPTRATRATATATASAIATPPDHPIQEEKNRKQEEEEKAGKEDNRMRLMDKLKEAMLMKLPAEKRALVGGKISQMFTQLQRTPDHPPYSAMIYRALQELKEEGGSTEESISNFIRKEYDDLPLAHKTLLNHHLKKLCESGEIVVSRGQRYLLEADFHSESTRKGRKKPSKKKRKKRSKKEEHHNMEESELIACKREPDEQSNDKVGDVIHGEEIGLVEGESKKQKQEGEVGNEILGSCDNADTVVGNDLKFMALKPSGLVRDGEVEPSKMVQPEISPSGGPKMIDVCASSAKEPTKLDQLVDSSPASTVKTADVLDLSTNISQLNLEEDNGPHGHKEAPAAESIMMDESSYLQDNRPEDFGPGIQSGVVVMTANILDLPILEKGPLTAEGTSDLKVSAAQGLSSHHPEQTEVQLTCVPVSGKSVNSEVAMLDLPREQLLQEDSSKVQEADGMQSKCGNSSFVVPVARQHNGGSNSDLRAPGTTVGLITAEAPCTDHLLSQLRQMSSNNPKPKNSVTLKMGIAASSDSQDGTPSESELPNPKNLQRAKQMNIRSTQTMVQRAKLRSWRKASASQIETASDPKSDQKIFSDSFILHHQTQPDQVQSEGRVCREPCKEDIESVTTKELPLSSAHEERQLEQGKRRGRPPKAKSSSDTLLADVLPLEEPKKQVHDNPVKDNTEVRKTENVPLPEQPQQLEGPRLRSRCPKPQSSDDTIMENELPLSSARQDRQVEQGKRRGRPPKTKTFADTRIANMLLPEEPTQQVHHEPVQDKIEVTATGELQLSSVQQDRKLEQGKRRGRPPKPKSSADAIMVDMLPSVGTAEQVCDKPSKEKIEVETKVELLSDGQEDQLEPEKRGERLPKPKNRGRGRPPKKSNANTHIN